MKRIKSLFLLFLLLLSVTAAGCGDRKDTRSYADASAKAVSGELKVHFIDVGQGDATLIQQGGHAMLIDAGNNDKGTAVQSYLSSQQVEKLDYVIGTHPDADHVGGLDVILYKFSWDKVILPQIEKDTKTFQDVLQVIQNKNRKITDPVPGETYSLGEASFTIVAPAGADYGDNANDYSVGILLTYGEKKFLFTGDAETASEQDMLKEGIDLSADVFKAGHHGSDTANTQEFLDKVHPASVVISCGEGNPYGHPRAAVMDELRALGADVYRTDEQGTIVASCDGKQITWNCSPSNTWKAGEPTGNASGDAGENSSAEDGGPDQTEPVPPAGQSVPAELQPDSDSASSDQKSSGAEDGAGGNGEGLQPAEPPLRSQTFILNTNTKKFHYPTCSSVEQIRESNKESTGKGREELIKEGYSPCKRCNP